MSALDIDMKLLVGWSAGRLIGWWLAAGIGLVLAEVCHRGGNGVIPGDQL